jgi:uncharacterized protein YheU (UPF0270 family)
MLIPYEELQPETLAGVIEDFVTREGAVHGHADASLQQKREAVMRQLAAGRVVIVFDETEETVSIVTKDDYRKMQSQQNELRYEQEE